MVRIGGVWNGPRAGARACGGTPPEWSPLCPANRAAFAPYEAGIRAGIAERMPTVGGRAVCAPCLDGAEFSARTLLPVLT